MQSSSVSVCDWPPFHGYERQTNFLLVYEQVKFAVPVSAIYSESTQIVPFQVLEKELTTNMPGSFFVLSGAHFCGMHVFSRDSFAYFNGTSGKCMAFMDI
jgi:hypothetical protein